MFKVFDSDAEQALALHRAQRVRRSRDAGGCAAAREHRDEDVRVLGLERFASTSCIPSCPALCRASTSWPQGKTWMPGTSPAMTTFDSVAGGER